MLFTSHWDKRTYLYFLVTCCKPNPDSVIRTFGQLLSTHTSTEVLQLDDAKKNGITIRLPFLKHVIIFSSENRTQLHPFHVPWINGRQLLGRGPLVVCEEFLLGRRKIWRFIKFLYVLEGITGSTTFFTQFTGLENYKICKSLGSFILVHELNEKNVFEYVQMLRKA